MNDVLALCRPWPEMQLAPGEILIEESVRTKRLFVLKRGSFEVVRDGVRLVVVNEPGAFLGEIAAILDVVPTATVVAMQDSTVHVIDYASHAVRTQPKLTFAIAQLLARRLMAVTAYLVDIKRQYAGSDTHLGIMDQVLGHLVVTSPVAIEPGSERKDVPDY
ncbi:MAG: Crp/Fnr family transcriptional regulator [Panacagrimonas sp.]